MQAYQTSSDFLKQPNLTNGYFYIMLHLSFFFQNTNIQTTVCAILIRFQFYTCLRNGVLLLLFTESMHCSFIRRDNCKQSLTMCSLSPLCCITRNYCEQSATRCSLIQLFCDAGINCEESVSWCSLSPCGDRLCSSVPQGYTCSSCPAGYEAFGNKCRGEFIIISLLW